MNSTEKLRVLFLGKDAGWGGMQRELLSIVQFLDKEKFAPMVIMQAGGPNLGLYREHAATHVFSEEYKPPRGLHPYLERCLPRRITYRIAPPRDIAEWADGLAAAFKPQIIVRQYMRRCPMFRTLEDSAIPTLQVFLMAGAQSERIDEESKHWLTTRPIVYPGKGSGYFLESCMGVDPSRSHAICTGLDLTVSQKQLSNPNRVRRQDLGFEEDDIVIATCGALIFLKGTDLWVEAAALLRDRFPDKKLKFLWVGGSAEQMSSVYGKSIVQLIEKRGLAGQVVITGSKPDVYCYDALCDIYVQASRDDAYPLATCEAMALSKPVVAFPQGVALEEPAQAAIQRVDEYHPQALADGIAVLLQDTDKRQEMGKAARSFIENYLEINGTMRRYEQLLLRLSQK